MARTRHHGLDWLRIGAFAILILYHIGMAFAPWDWVVKTPYRFTWLIPPMAAVTPWRLALLFAVSGYASRAMFDRSGSAGAFAAQRNPRLLIPLVFGMIVLVPLEMWVRVMENGYPHGLVHFWLYDNFRIGEFFGQHFPSWEHLWFVEYLWAYTMILAGVLAWRGVAVMAALDRLAGWLMTGTRLLWAPVGAMVVVKLALLFVVPERQGLFTDWSGHAMFVPFFLFGFVLGGRPALWEPIARLWRPALLVAGVSGAFIVMVETTYPGQAIPPHAVMAMDRAARLAMGWSMVLALLYLANRFLDRDHRWRKPLAEAVFPFYLVHHAAIVLTVWFALPLDLPAGALFALVLGVTCATCAITYLVGRRIGWLRPLIGLRPVEPDVGPPRPVAVS